MPPSTRAGQAADAHGATAGIKQVANEAGVSTATVSRVLSGKGPASADARTRVLRAARSLDYHPSLSARSLRTDRSMIIGVLVPSLANPVFLPFLRAVEHRAQRHGYAVLVADTQHSAEVERHQLDRLRAQRVDALILAGAPRDPGHVRRLGDAGVVVTDPDTFAGQAGRSAAAFQADAIGDACRHLAGHGHRRIAYLTRGSSLPGRSSGRWQLIDTTCRSLGIDAEHHSMGAPGVPEDIASRMGRLLGSADPPAAVWSGSHPLAPELLEAMAVLDIDIPGRCSFLTFGDSPWAAAYRPSISVVVGHLAAVADAMTSKVLHQLGVAGPPPPVMVEPDVFVARRSTGPVPA